MNARPKHPVEGDVLAALERRLGRVHARQRLGIEQDHEARVFGDGLNFFHPENWYAAHTLTSAALKASGLYWRGHKNARDVQLKRNVVVSPGLPLAFDRFTILHLSDLHTDTSKRAMDRVIELLPGLKYDICVWTGDYRGRTAGPYGETLRGLERIRRLIAGEVFGVLGNHDSILMVPGLEAMGVKMLLNEATRIVRDGQHINLAGVDDAHYFRVDNIEKAAEHIVPDEYSILLSHTPEIYRQAAHAGFKLMLCGHTHGGQICLPGSVPFMLDADLPRRFGSGAWSYRNMIGYTSVGAGTSIVPVRFNCAPEITLHELRGS